MSQPETVTIAEGDLGNGNGWRLELIRYPKTGLCLELMEIRNGSGRIAFSRPVAELAKERRRI